MLVLSVSVGIFVDNDRVDTFDGNTIDKGGESSETPGLIWSNSSCGEDSQRATIDELALIFFTYREVNRSLMCVGDGG